MNKVFIRLIGLYQQYISPLKKPSCVFYPTCSQYAKIAFTKYSFFKASIKVIYRILRCHPWQKNHIDNT